MKKLKQALSKTRSQLGDKLRGVFRKPLSPETLDEIEQILFEADLGTQTAVDFTKRLEKIKDPTPDRLIAEMKNYAREILNQPIESKGKIPEKGDPLVILMVGVNGSGKTTSTAKLAKRYRDEGKSVLLAAADTFRAAAIEQLEIWSQRLNLPIVKGMPGGDPSAVLFDALSSAKAKGIDVVIADTAGRLESKKDLMAELEKIKRVSQKIVPNAPHEIYLVLDATIGQNAIDQAKIFNEFTPLSGLVLSKLDGSAKGGIILGIRREMGLPVSYIGIGEGADDFAPFDVDTYVEALFGEAL